MIFQRKQDMILLKKSVKKPSYMCKTQLTVLKIINTIGTVYLLPEVAASDVLNQPDSSPPEDIAPVSEL